MDLREALYTTRAMRRVKPDPIPEDVQLRILDAAIRAPSGGNTQGWRFMLVDDPDVIGQIAPIYRSCMEVVFSSIYGDRMQRILDDPEHPDAVRDAKMRKSVEYAAANFESYPLLLFSFATSDFSGSLLPPVWSAMLAARAEGVGSCLTQGLAMQADAVHEILGVPTDADWRMESCVTMGYPTGRWGVAARVPAHDVSYRNQWGAPLGSEVPEPLWP